MHYLNITTQEFCLSVCHQAALKGYVVANYKNRSLDGSDQNVSCSATQHQKKKPVPSEENSANWR